MDPFGFIGVAPRYVIFDYLKQYDSFRDKSALFVRAEKSGKHFLRTPCLSFTGTKIFPQKMFPQLNRSLQPNGGCPVTKHPLQIPADMRLLFSIGIPYFLLPNLDSVNHCTSKYLFISILISLLVQWLTESRFGKTKFGFPIEIRSSPYSQHGILSSLGRAPIPENISGRKYNLKPCIPVYLANDAGHIALHLPQS
jgi:hypothetical protein